MQIERRTTMQIKKKDVHENGEAAVKDGDDDVDDDGDENKWR